MKHKLNRMGIWAYMLTKRIYKKPTFLIILLLIPIVAFSFSLIAKEDSGFVTIAVCDKSKGDTLNRELIDELTKKKSLIRFIEAESPQRSRALVETGKADAAWIFPDNLQSSIDKFAKDPNPRNAFIEIIQQEESMFLKISREKLTGVFFESLSKSSYVSYLRQSTPELADMTDEELVESYFKVTTPESLFVFESLDSSKPVEDTNDKSYLITPLRGLMSVLTVLSGLATAMFFMKDKSSGLFSWVPLKLHWAVEFSYQLISVLSVSLAVTVSLCVAGVSEGFITELASLLVLSLTSASFCMLVRILSKNLRTLSILLPLLVITMITMCPVFFSFKVARLIKFLFPPTYYLSVHSAPVFLLYGLAYSIVLGAIYGVIKYRTET